MGSRARRATAADVDEILRLRAVMIAAVTGEPVEPGPWQDHARQVFLDRLAAGTLNGFVVDGPSGPGLVSCALGTIEQRLAGPANPEGRIGHVFSVATDTAHRRQGHSRACLQALIAWYTEQRVPTVDLHASGAGEPLYAFLGFVRSEHPAMRLRLPLGTLQPDEP
jgi:GNAT superfamily N-acetyltransferase